MLNNKDVKLKMPAVFIGHGSPMNAIEENEFVHNWRLLGEQLFVPKAIISISAHWETRGTLVTSMLSPRTIHDFGGFPHALYQIQYSAPGNPALATELTQMIKTTTVATDEAWGLDHGTWSVLSRIYPHAGIPVIQLSLDRYKTPEQHYQLAKHLNYLRNNGVLIIGSGNIVHNLGLVDWNKPGDYAYGHDWAIEANELVKRLINEKDHTALVHYTKLGKAVQLAVPTPDHFLPLLYVLALQDNDDTIKFFNDKAVMGSLTMTSVIIG